jgi:hypothetical protein
VIHRSEFPICPIHDPSEEVNSTKKTVVFHFKGGHVFQDEYRTSPTETIEGNIWQAGTDPGVILLGLYFTDGSRILLNTIHIAKADGESSDVIDRGLIVRTFPLRHN